jgi:hypothetical protein
MKTSLFALLVLLLPVSDPLCQDPQSIQVRMKDGQFDRIVPLSLTGDTARYRVFVLGEEMTVTRKLSEFTPLGAFQFEEFVTAPKSFEDHFGLAKKAAQLGLLPQVGAAARRAVAAVQGTPEAGTRTTEVRAWAAGTLETWVRAAVTAKDLAAARHSLGLLTTRLSDQRTEEQLELLANQVDELAQVAATAKDAERQAKLDAKARDSMQRRLRPIMDRIAQGDRLQKQGMSQSRQVTKSANLCAQSIDAYKAAWKALHDLMKDNEGNADLTEQLAAIGTRVHDSGIRSALHAANMLCVRSDYKGATEWTTKVLAFDPDNAEAKELARTIQIAAADSSDDWGWQWHIVGGGQGSASNNK